MSIDRLAEQQIRLYESRLKHIDELIEKARQGLDGHPERERHEKTLADIIAQRDRLQVKIDELRLENPENWDEEIEKAGLMGIWDIIAQDLEKLIEKLGG